MFLFLSLSSHLLYSIEQAKKTIMAKTVIRRQWWKAGEKLQTLKIADE
jgi:hypothetical protein